MKVRSTRGSIGFKAFPLSLLIYLLPIIGPHGWFLWGSLLWHEVIEGRGRREVAWIIADLALALSLQLVLLVLLIWILRGQAWRRWIAVLPAAVGFVVTLNWLYLVSIPTHFLIDPESALEQSEAEIVCRISDAVIAPLRAGVQLELAQAGEAWIERLPDLGYGVLSMPGCKVRDIDRIDRTGPQGVGSVESVARGGAALFSRWNPKSSVAKLLFLSAEGSEPVPVSPPDQWTRGPWRPILSADGQAIAWLDDGAADAGAPSAARVRIRSLVDGSEEIVQLDGAVVRRAQLIAFEASAGELVISNNSTEMLGIGLQGELRWGPVGIPSIGYLSDHNFRRHAGGWLAWDSAGEEGPYSVAWSLILGEGIHQILKGRSITSVALDPWSRYIAISVSPRHSIGDVRDAVYLIRTNDGHEVYRRYFDPYSRSHVAFLGPHFLALTAYEETAGKATQRIEVVRIPGPTSIAQARRWIAAYRQVVLPLLPMYERFDNEGIGEGDCAPLHQAQDAAVRMPPLEDQVTMSTFEALRERLGLAIFQCDRWDPGPFSDAFAEMEFLITGIEETLVYEHGLQAVPEAESLRFDGYSIRPTTGPDGKVRAKRFR